MNLKKLKPWLNSFVDLLYPRVCNACLQPLLMHEKTVCNPCLYRMPKTNFHYKKGNPVEELFFGRADIYSATAFYFFQPKSLVQTMIHRLKYKNHPEIGDYIGEVFGKDLMLSPVFNTVDYVLPVPLHPKKKKIRGYNQAEYIAIGLSLSMNGELDTQSLYRRKHTSSQTKKSRFDRWQNVHQIFALKSQEKFQGKHILIVDDVVTTGSTLEACAHAFDGIEGVKVSLATLAFPLQ